MLPLLWDKSTAREVLTIYWATFFLALPRRSPKTSQNRIWSSISAVSGDTTNIVGWIGREKPEFRVLSQLSCERDRKLINKGFSVPSGQRYESIIPWYERLNSSWLLLAQIMYIFKVRNNTKQGIVKRSRTVFLHRHFRRHVLFAYSGLSFYHRFLLKIDAPARKTSLTTVNRND